MQAVMQVAYSSQMCDLCTINVKKGNRIVKNNSAKTCTKNIAHHQNK